MAGKVARQRVWCHRSLASKVCFIRQAPAVEEGERGSPAPLLQTDGFLLQVARYV